MGQALSKATNRDHRAGAASRAAQNGGAHADTVQERILEIVHEVRILEPLLFKELIRERQARGIDKYDEVWNGVYVMSPLASNPHQRLVTRFTVIFDTVLDGPICGEVLPGANVSDRRKGWEYNFRDPDITVVLEGSRAVDCGTHYMGGPDFLLEIKSPRDDTEAKVPFYSQVQVRELLIVHRDTRELALYRHDGQELRPVPLTPFKGGQWLVSEVLPLAFRRKVTRSEPRIEVRRTDGRPGRWTVE